MIAEAMVQGLRGYAEASYIFALSYFFTGGKVSSITWKDFVASFPIALPISFFC
jgi:hypothetical protein